MELQVLICPPSRNPWGVTLVLEETGLTVHFPFHKDLAPYVDFEKNPTVIFPLRFGDWHCLLRL